MKKNVGKTDSVLRLVIGAVLLVVGLTAPVGTGLRVLVFVFMAVAFFTAIFGF